MVSFLSLFTLKFHKKGAETIALWELKKKLHVKAFTKLQHIFIYLTRLIFYCLTVFSITTDTRLSAKWIIFANVCQVVESARGTYPKIAKEQIRLAYRSISDMAAAKEWETLSNLMGIIHRNEESFNCFFTWDVLSIS